MQVFYSIKTSNNMNQKELYQECIKLTPYLKQKTDDYRNNLRQALDTYKSLLLKLDDNQRPDRWNEIFSHVNKVTDKIKDIALNSYKGLPSTAGATLSNMMRDYGDKLIWKDIPVDTYFYRMRIIEDRRTNITYDEMFHIPLNKRRVVTTQRYSTPGYPCLYLGKSIYTCWEEMNRPRMSDCWVSQLKNTQKICLLDLRVPSLQSFWDNQNYILLFPVIIACMLPVTNSNDIYKPEYIIPQLLTEWIIKKKRDGIYYTSTHKNSYFDYPGNKYDNIAIPVKDPINSKKYCKMLKSFFRITQPLNNEIEQLRNGYGIDAGHYGLDEEEQKKENYELSDFGKLEKRLSETEDFCLH